MIKTFIYKSSQVSQNMYKAVVRLPFFDFSTPHKIFLDILVG